VSELELARARLADMATQGRPRRAAPTVRTMAFVLLEYVGDVERTVGAALRGRPCVELFPSGN